MKKSALSVPYVEVLPPKKSFHRFLSVSFPVASSYCAAFILGQSCEIEAICNTHYENLAFSNPTSSHQLKNSYEKARNQYTT